MQLHWYNYSINRDKFRTTFIAEPRQYRVTLNKTLNMALKLKGDEMAFLISYVSLCKLMLMLFGSKGIFSFRYFLSFLNKNTKLLTLKSPLLEKKNLFFFVQELLSLYTKLSLASLYMRRGKFYYNSIVLDRLNYIFRYKRGFNFAGVTLSIHQPGPS